MNWVVGDALRDYGDDALPDRFAEFLAVALGLVGAFLEEQDLADICRGSLEKMGRHLSDGFLSVLGARDRVAGLVEEG